MSSSTKPTIYNQSQFSRRNIALLLDDVDTVMRKQRHFERWLLDLVNRCGISLIISSRTPVNRHLLLKYGKY